MQIFIADDHQVVREGLKQTIHQIDHDCTIHEASTGAELLEKVTELDAGDRRPTIDVILLDYFLPDINGDVLLETLSSRHPEIPVIVISAAADRALIQKALDRGASGFISKSTRSEVLLGALKLVLAGGVYLPPELIQTDGVGHDGNDRIAVSDTDANDLLTQLTDRQREVLVLMAQGMTNKDISKALQLSENTIKVHITAIFKVLGVANRTHAVILAQRIGLASAPPNP